MIQRFFIVVATSALMSACVSPGPVAPAAKLPAALPAPILAMLDAAAIPPDAMGAIVIRLPDGVPILSHRSDASLQPASVMKLVTTIVGLEKLGPTTRWYTELLTHASVENDVLQGDLVLRGGGDGDLTSEAFSRMLRLLRQKGIREIRGDLILDRQLFQPTRTDVGVAPFDEEPEAAYNVIPDALLMNMNLLRFEFASDGQALRVHMTPELDRVSIDVSMKLIDRACENWDDGWQSPGYTKSADGSIRIQLRGEFPRNCSASTNINVLERDELIDRLFRTLWASHGGTFAGTTREGSAAPGGRLLARHRSRPLADMLREINKPSDNALTRLLYLSLGTLDSIGDGNSFDKAERQVRAWLRQQGVDDNGLVLENGSGLSRKERIRPAQLAALLVAEHRSNWAPEFLSSMPIVGLDGTMRLRLRDSPVAGRARMKTGTLNNVVALAGYVPNAAGQTCVVVAIINFNPATGKLWPVGRPILDALIDWVGRSDMK